MIESSFAFNLQRVSADTQPFKDEPRVTTKAAVGNQIVMRQLVKSFSQTRHHHSCSNWGRSASHLNFACRMTYLPCNNILACTLQETAEMFTPEVLW